MGEAIVQPAKLGSQLRQGVGQVCLHRFQIPVGTEIKPAAISGEFRRQEINNKDLSASELSSMKIADLEQHIAKYEDPEQGYLSRFAVELAENMTGDYDHLARVREWSSGGDKEGGGDG